MIKIKKLLSPCITLIIILFSFSSCEEKDKKEPPTVLAPEQIVEVDQAKEMYDRYTDRRVPLIQHYEDSIDRAHYDSKILQHKKAKSKAIDSNSDKKFDVARYVSYDYKTIKQYLAYIEQEAKKANVEISSLRFYFSNYPDKSFFDNKDSVLHPRQNSLLLSPTLKKGDREYLFYIGGTKTEEQAILLTDNFGEINNQEIGATDRMEDKAHASILPNLTNTTTNPALNTSFYSGTSLTMNKGTGAPPPWNEN